MQDIGHFAPKLISVGLGILNAVNVEFQLDAQLQWLASYANTRERPVELGNTVRAIHNFMNVIGANDAVIKKDNGDFTQYVLNRTLCKSVDGYILFGHFAFSFYNAPSKAELEKEYRRTGYEDVMRLTWFCYDPIDGEPCGQCWTCVHTYRDGITDRFSPAALERYHEREQELSSISKARSACD